MQQRLQSRRGLDPRRRRRRRQAQAPATLPRWWRLHGMAQHGTARQCAGKTTTGGTQCGSHTLQTESRSRVPTSTGLTGLTAATPLAAPPHGTAPHGTAPHSRTRLAGRQEGNVSEGVSLALAVVVLQPLRADGEGQHTLWPAAAAAATQGRGWERMRGAFCSGWALPHITTR